MAVRSFTALWRFALFSWTLADPLTTITPCPNAPSSISTPAPVEVTAQYQDVSTCTIRSHCVRSVCQTKVGYTTFPFVSTMIPQRWDGTTASSTLVTDIHQRITISAERVTKAVNATDASGLPGAQMWNASHFDTSTTGNTAQPVKVIINRILVVPYDQLGPLAIPGYDGSGLCRQCIDQAGNRKQVVTVSECRTKAKRSTCTRHTETWISAQTTRTPTAASNTISPLVPPLAESSSTTAETSSTSPQTSVPSASEEMLGSTSTADNSLRSPPQPSSVIVAGVQQVTSVAAAISSETRPTSGTGSHGEPGPWQFEQPAPELSSTSASQAQPSIGPSVRGATSDPSHMPIHLPPPAVASSTFTSVAGPEETARNWPDWPRPAIQSSTTLAILSSVLPSTPVQATSTQSQGDHWADWSQFTSVPTPTPSNCFYIQLQRSNQRFGKRAPSYIKFDGDDAYLTDNRSDAALFDLDGPYLKQNGMFVGASEVTGTHALEKFLDVSISLSGWSRNGDSLSFRVGVNFCIAATSNVIMEMSGSPSFQCTRYELIAENVDGESCLPCKQISED